MSETSLALVGDIGGTNARLALADISDAAPRIGHIRFYASREFPQLDDVIAAYLRDTGARPAVAVLAVAGPIENGAVHFTNLGWSIAQAQLVQMGFAQARLINDFAALALAMPLLRDDDLYTLGPDVTGHPQKTMAVMGPGTGFGAAALVRGMGRETVMASEGGHASFAPADETEIAVLRFLTKRFGHVSNERILSGPGLCQLHQALNAIEHHDHAIDDPAAITQLALSGEERALRTVERFCAILGSVAGNLALSYGAEGGVFIAGGIAPTIITILQASAFRTRFEAKGRFADYLRRIPTRVILRGDPAFLGAARVARELV
jgi:glucokinase